MLPKLKSSQIASLVSYANQKRFLSPRVLKLKTFPDLQGVGGDRDSMLVDPSVVPASTLLISTIARPIETVVPALGTSTVDLISHHTRLA